MSDPSSVNDPFHNPGVSLRRLLPGRRARAVSLNALLLVLTLGCRGSDGSTGPEAPEVAALEVEPASVTVTPGETTELEATPVDDGGNPVSGYEVSWTIGDTLVATVDGGGTVTARSVGATEVIASADEDGRSLTGQSDVAVEDTGSNDGGSSASGALITNLEPAAYERDTLQTDDSVYVDRDYTIDGVPAGYEGWRYVRTANDDKDATGDSAVIFTLTDTARVALAYDERATTLPDWLRDWTATGDTLRTTDVDHLVYTRVFAPGEVALGGNMSSGAEGARSMYVLSATRSDSPPDDGGGSGSDSTTVTGSLEVVTSTTGDSLDPDGYTVSVDGSSQLSIGINDTTVFADLSGEDQTVELSGVAGNCSVSGDNPRTVSVPENDTASNSFDVNCEATVNKSADPIWTDDFESGDFNWAASNDDTGWDDRPWSNADDIEVNQENPRTGSYSMMIRFPDHGDLNEDGRWPEGSGGANTKAHWQVDHFKEFWVEFYMYVPDNYKHPEQEATSNNRKFFVIWDEDRRDEHVAFYYELHRSSETNHSPPLSSKLRLYQNMRYRDDEMRPWFSGGGGLGCGDAVNTCPGDVIEEEDRGAWIQLRFHYKLSSANGVADGAFHLWKDGELVMGQTGIDAYPDNGGGCDGDCNFYLHHGQLFGAQNSPYDEVTKFYFDNFRIYKEDPGW